MRISLAKSASQLANAPLRTVAANRLAFKLIGTAPANLKLIVTKVAHVLPLMARRETAAAEA